MSVFNCWKGVDGRDVVERDSPGKTKNSPKGDDVKPLGAKQAFQVNADNKGYVQEVAIPWKLITSNGAALKAGDKFIITIEPNFTAGPTNGRMTIKDIFRPGVNLDRVFTFQNKRIWGEATLEAMARSNREAPAFPTAASSRPRLDNGIPVVDWTGLVQATELAGFKEIAFAMPEDGYVSLQILGPRPGRRPLAHGRVSQQGQTHREMGRLGDRLFRRPGAAVPAGRIHLAGHLS